MSYRTGGFCPFRTSVRPSPPTVWEEALGPSTTAPRASSQVLGASSQVLGASSQAQGASNQAL